MAASAYEATADLIQACLARDPRAWTEFVVRYQRLICSIARRRGFDMADIEDICQDVLLCAYRDLGRLQRPEALVSWLITITVRICNKHLQRHPQYTSLSEDQPDDYFEEARQQTDVRIDVVSALDQLDPRSRALLSALFLDDPGSGYKAVAQRLTIPIGSIGPKRARGIKRFRKVFEPAAPQPRPGDDRSITDALPR